MPTKKKKITENSGLEVTNEKKEITKCNQQRKEINE